jgi:hypothetical protein
MKKHWKLITITTAIVIIVVISFAKFYDPYRIDLTADDKNSIIETVNSYYKALETQDYSKALSYCEIDDNNNYIHLNTQTRIICLRELRKYIISSLKYDSLERNGSNGAVIMNYDTNKKAFCVSAIYELSYTNTDGCALEDNVYLRKINNVWKIVNMISMDRYVAYRVGCYEYETEPYLLLPN